MTALTCSLNVVTTDDIDTDDLADLHQLDVDDVAVARPRPHRRNHRDGPLQTALLEAVGVSDDVSGAGRDVTADWHHLIVLLGDIDDLVIIDAHHLSSTQLRSVLRLAVTTNTHLWLLLHTQHYTPEQHNELAAWPVQRVSSRRFLHRYHGHQRPEATQADTQVRVPRSDFPTFRADCRDMLNTDEFAAVDDRYVDARQTAADWIDGRDDIDEDSLAEWLRTQLDGCATVDQMQVTLRAAQAAFFLAGWLLKVDLDGFLGANDRVHTPAARSAETWRRLRVYRQSHRRTACVLAAAAGLSLDQMHQLHVADVADDGSHIAVEGRQVPIEAPARPLLRQHVLHQQTLGHADDGLLLTRISNGKALSDHQLKRAITDPLLEAGVALLNGQVVRRTLNPRRWTRRRGISITQL